MWRQSRATMPSSLLRMEMRMSNPSWKAMYLQISSYAESGIEEESASHSELPLVCLEERPLTSVNPSDIPESISQQYSTIKETVQTNLIHVNAILENLNCFDLHPHLRTIEKTQKNLNIRVLLSLTTVNIHLHRVELTRFQ